MSVQTLAFVARRLLAERVGLVFALREPGADHDLEGLPELVSGALAAGDARRLLDATIPGSFDARVRDRILGEAGGNPLALLELPRERTTIAVAGGFGLDGGAAYGADVPFGGYKASGVGRQNGHAGFDQYLEVKSVAWPAG